jgi:hypothetical protein
MFTYVVCYILYQEIKEKFEDLPIFRLYFVIPQDSSCISTMYYLLLL